VVVGYPQHIFPHRRGHVATGIRWPTFRRPTFLLHQQRYPPGKRLGGDVTQIQGGGFEVTGGTLVILKNGSPVLSPSTLTINVTGGTTAAYSNIALTFGGVAAGHFGGQPVNGNVQKSH
jgi:hypothetical protein